MGKTILEKPARRDDPIYGEGLTISTPRSHRGSTPSTKSSPKSTVSGSDRGSADQKAPEAK